MRMSPIPMLQTGAHLFRKQRVRLPISAPTEMWWSSDLQCFRAGSSLFQSLDVGGIGLGGCESNIFSAQITHFLSR